MAKRILIILFLILISCVNIFAQDTQLQEQDRLLEEEITRELEKIRILPPEPKEKKLSIRLGGWYSTTFRSYRNLDNDWLVKDTVSNSLSHDLRLWANLVFFRTHNLYLRIQNEYIKRKTAQSYTGIGDDYDGPHLDIGYLMLRFGGKRKKPISLTLGRQHLYIGRGIAYSDVHDGIKFVANSPNFFFKALISQTKPYEDNIDTSVPDYDKEGKRQFFGLESAYLGIPNYVFYLFWLKQKDLIDEHPEDDAQSYNYDSQYIGSGLEGRLKLLNWWLELIYEQGKSFTDITYTSEEKKDIQAYAADLGIKYLFPIKTLPIIEFEYGYGSGDKDRVSVYKTAEGNVKGYDKNFLYFGNYFSGYALSPRLSNLHILKFDLSFKPLEKFSLTKDLAIGGKYFIYRKDRAEGGIYDTEATLNSRDVGREVNLYFYWHLTKNSYWSMRYGYFYPGKAYPDATNDQSEYFFTRFTINF